MCSVSLLRRHRPVVPVLGRLRQEDEASLDCTADPVLVEGKCPVKVVNYRKGSG